MLWQIFSISCEIYPLRILWVKIFVNWLRETIGELAENSKSQLEMIPRISHVWISKKINTKSEQNCVQWSFLNGLLQHLRWSSLEALVREVLEWLWSIFLKYCYGQKTHGGEACSGNKSIDHQAEGDGDFDSDVGLVKEKFLSTFVGFVFLMILKELSKKKNFTEIKLSSFSFDFCWLFLTENFFCTPENNLNFSGGVRRPT